MASSIDYRCEDGRFPVFASCVAILNPNSIFNSETGVNSGIRSLNNHFSDSLIELEVRKPLMVSISQKSEELKFYNLV
jgi:hypothetical protein